MYEFNTRIRYSETDESGRLSLLSMVNYLQDCSTFQSQDCGVGVEYLKKEQKAWLLSAWDIRIDRLPALGESMVIGTAPHEIRGMTAARNFWIRTVDHTMQVRADSVWFLVNLTRNLPVKIQPKDIEPYGALENVLLLTTEGRKVMEGENPERGLELIVEQHHIDTNHHMNNAQYISIAADVLYQMKQVKAGQIERIRAEYKKSAVLGDRMIPWLSISTTRNSYVVSLKNETGESYANVELFLKENGKDGKTI